MGKKEKALPVMKKSEIKEALKKLDEFKGSISEAYTRHRHFELSLFCAKAVDHSLQLYARLKKIRLPELKDLGRELSRTDPEFLMRVSVAVLSPDAVLKYRNTFDLLEYMQGLAENAGKSRSDRVETVPMTKKNKDNKKSSTRSKHAKTEEC